MSSFPASTNIQKVKSAIQLYSIIVERLSSQPVSQSSAGFMFLQTTDCHTRHSLFTLQVLNISSLCTEVEMGVESELGCSLMADMETGFV